MSGRTAWETQQKFDAYLSMKLDNGAAPPGSVDADYLNALRDAPLGRASEVAQAHKQNAAPPAFDRGEN